MVRMRDLAALAVAASLGGGATWAARGAGVEASAFQRLPAGQPNLNGIWQTMNSANWDLEAHPARPGVASLGTLLATPPGRSVVEGSAIPYRPEALEQRRKNYAERWTADPEA